MGGKGVPSYRGLEVRLETHPVPGGPKPARPKTSKYMVVYTSLVCRKRSRQVTYVVGDVNTCVFTGDGSGVVPRPKIRVFRGPKVHFSGFLGGYPPFGAILAPKMTEKHEKTRFYVFLGTFEGSECALI